MNTASDSLNRLYAYCRRQDWIGYDPFDGLNSRIFQAIPLVSQQRMSRLIFLQFHKRFPLNLRPFWGIKKERNPKGIGLFLLALLKLYKEKKDDEYLQLINNFKAWLIEDISDGYSGACWGYNFKWQSRAFYLPKGYPTVVNTSYIARAFLMAFEILGDKEDLRIARSACDFVLKDLHRLEDGHSVGFSYTPLDNYYVNNATALASALLSSVYKVTREEKLREYAKKSIQFVIDNQKKNGSWNYAEDATGLSVGIDNFHTGFILESIMNYIDSTSDSTYAENLNKGLHFYQENLFADSGIPKYFHNKLYPIDIHSAAQAIITLSALRNRGADMRICQKVVNWTIQNLQDKQGYFYYQKTRFYLNKISYMRWAQAWMLLALVNYAFSQNNER